jgi:rubredoxin-NAD+ reductase
MAQEAPVLIIGTGLAGYNLAREFRKLAPDAELSLISADGGEFYSKPMLSNALAAKKLPEQIPLSDATKMAQQLRAEIVTGQQVSTIDLAQQRVRFGAMERTYQRLVLAVGAEQIRLPLAGDAADRVLTVNDLRDYARFHAALAGVQRVAVIGAGLIGCEFANDLLSSGYQVELIDIAELPLPRLLPPRAGIALRDALAAGGVSWRLGEQVASVDATGSGLVVRLASGAVIACDLVLSAVGLRPKTALARGAGIAVNRGVVADRQLRTSAPGVYALGDCAEIVGLLLPYVLPLTQAARALAKILVGSEQNLSYPCMPVTVKTPLLPVVVAPPIDPSAVEWEFESLEGGLRALARDAAGHLLGFALLGQASAERGRWAKDVAPWLGDTA